MSAPAAAPFDIAYETHGTSVRLAEIFREAFGSEAPPPDVAPYSFVSLTDLHHIVLELGVDAGEIFADLACGSGGPCLWVARETAAKAVGFDFSRVAVERASARADRSGMADRVRFAIGDLSATGAADGEFDGAMSTDALWLAPDKPAALREAARILKRGAAFVFTTWESPLPLPNLPALVTDHRPLLEAAGFEVLIHEETAGWRERQRTVYEGILDGQRELRAELGEAAATIWIREALVCTGRVDGVDYLEPARRVFVKARRL